MTQNNIIQKDKCIQGDDLYFDKIFKNNNIFVHFIVFFDLQSN